MKNPFSMLGSFVMVTVLCIFVSVYYQLDIFNTALLVTFGWFFFGKLAFAMSFQQGYGVKNGVKTVLGMPVLMATYVVVIASFVTFLLVSAYQPSALLPETVANIRAFGWSAASGVAMAICHWYFYARQAYFYQSEYNIRKECEARGDSPEVTEATVVRYRSLGIVQ